MIPTTSKSITLDPYQVLPMAVMGMVFSCSQASAEFLISFDGQGFIPMRQGWTMDNRPSAFKQIVFQNPTAVQITLEFYAGASALFYSPPTTLALITQAATYTKGSGVLNIGAGAVLAYTGVDGTHTRKQIIVTNLDAAAALYLCDNAGNLMLPIFAGESKTFDLSGACKLANTNGAAVAAIVGEVSYS